MRQDTYSVFFIDCSKEKIWFERMSRKEAVE